MWPILAPWATACWSQVSALLSHLYFTHLTLNPFRRVMLTVPGSDAKTRHKPFKRLLLPSFLAAYLCVTRYVYPQSWQISTFLFHTACFIGIFTLQPKKKQICVVFFFVVCKIESSFPGQIDERLVEFARPSHSQHSKQNMTVTGV